MRTMTPEITEKLLGQLNLVWQKVGSRITCSPAPTNTDHDYLVIGMGDTGALLREAINELGFVHEGEPDNDLYLECNFASYRKDDINLIVCETADFYDDFLLATEVATRFNLMDKDDRIILFQAILYRNRIDL